LRQLYGLLRVNQLCRSTGIAYDWVIRLRPDVEFIQLPEPLESLDPNFIYVPRINNWYGYSDRFNFGSPALMNVYMERYTEHRSFMLAGGKHHLESYLAHTLRRHHIPIARTNATFNLLRMDGTRDEPYRNLAWGDVP
jgi:hypothetical protein